MSRVIVLGIIIAVAACSPGDTAQEQGLVRDAPPLPRNEADVAVAREPSAAVVDESAALDDPEPADPAVLADSAHTLPSAPSIPNHCERLQVFIDAEGRQRYKRVRRTWTEADRRRFGQLVTLVAKEMGAEPRLIRAWAMRESTFRPHAMHVLNPDVEAAAAAWRRFYYSPQEEAELRAQMARVTAQDPQYWQAKARLHQVQTFRDNPYLDEVVELEVVAPDGSRSPGSEPAWAFGYGPFGFNPAYFVPVWDPRAPPWVFCADDGLVAIVTAVWAARAAKRECEAQGFGGSYASVNQRFSQGHCGVVGERAKFRGRARRMGLDPDAHAKLGHRWPRSDADRGELLRTMRYKAMAAGLLSGIDRPPGA